MRRWAVFLGAVILLIGILISGTPVEREITSQTSRTILENEQWYVLPGQYKSFPVSLSAGESMDVYLRLDWGDINFYIMDQNGKKCVERWRITGTSESWTAPSSGTYYIVLDNTFSLITPKRGYLTVRVVSPLTSLVREYPYGGLAGLIILIGIIVLIYGLVTKREKAVKPVKVAEVELSLQK